MIGIWSFKHTLSNLVLISLELNQVSVGSF